MFQVVSRRGQQETEGYSRLVVFFYEAPCATCSAKGMHVQVISGV